MSRRASRPAGTRARPRAAAGGAKPLQTLTDLFTARGTDRAEAALDRWLEAMVESPEVFQASAVFLAGSASEFSRDERWLLLSMAADMAQDPMLSDCCDELERRLDEEAELWPSDTGDSTAHDESLREDSPQYRALSDAWSSVRRAIEVSFLRDVNMTEMSRAMIEDVNMWQRTLRDGEATLLGVPRIVLTADDDPFGILLP